MEVQLAKEPTYFTISEVIKKMIQKLNTRGAEAGEGRGKRRHNEGE